MLQDQVHHLTINPHPNDINMFEDILEDLPAFLNDFENWFYNIEKDNTPQRHAHIIINYSGSARFDNRSRKIRKYLMDKIEGTCSKQYGNKGFLRQSHPKDDHNKKKVLGYAAKDLCPENRTRSSGDVIAHLCKSNVPYWLEHSDEKVTTKNWKDIINIQKNTAVCVLLNYIKLNKLELDPSVFEDMKEKGYSFIGLSTKNKRDIYLELKVQMGTSTKEDKSESYKDWLHNPEEQSPIGLLLYLKETKNWSGLKEWFTGNETYPAGSLDLNDPDTI